jgi:hypothetical protein
LDDEQELEELEFGRSKKESPVKGGKGKGKKCSRRRKYRKLQKGATKQKKESEPDSVEDMDMVAMDSEDNNSTMMLTDSEDSEDSSYMDSIEESESADDSDSADDNECEDEYPSLKSKSEVGSRKSGKGGKGGLSLKERSNGGKGGKMTLKSKSRSGKGGASGKGGSKSSSGKGMTKNVENSSKLSKKSMETSRLRSREKLSRR